MKSSSFIASHHFSSSTNHKNGCHDQTSLLTLLLRQPIRVHLIKADERQWKHDGGWK